MKKVCLLSILMSLAISTTVNAAEHRWGVMGSYWSPADVSDGFGPEVRFAFGMSDHILLDLRGSYFSDLNDPSMPNTTLEAMPLEGGLTITTDNNDTFDFYAGLGGGYYDISIKHNGHSYDTSSSGGFYAAIGTEIVFCYEQEYLDITKATIAIEAIYRNVTTESIPGMDDISLSGLGAKIGILLRW